MACKAMSPRQLDLATIFGYCSAPLSQIASVVLEGSCLWRVDHLQSAEVMFGIVWCSFPPQVTNKMALIPNRVYKEREVDIFNDLTYHLYSPVNPWPSNRMSASQLRHGTHFNSVRIGGEERTKLDDFLKPLKSVDIVENRLHKEITALLCDLSQSTGCLCDTKGKK